MHVRRRQFLGLIGSLLTAGIGALLRPVAAMAADWNKSGFESRSVADVLKYLNAGAPAKSDSISLKVPEIADEGSVVPVAISSRIPTTQMIALIVDNNTHPLAASFTFFSGADPGFSAQVKLRRTSPVRVLVQAGGKYFHASKEVKVATTGPCDAGS